jgi:GT2 family glycosyltransferase/glycosyltransferase involved in cell wall biosynthesis
VTQADRPPIPPGATGHSDPGDRPSPVRAPAHGVPNLKDLYAGHQGKVSDKWSSYLSEYDRLFTPYRGRRINLLEIGVQNGGSLDIWAQYFRRAKRILGCDIDPACAALVYDDERISVIVGDANSHQVQQAILRDTAHLDIVIDDGSHTSADIVGSFARYFPLVSNNGIYVIEDLHCSYWRRFGGGLFDPFSAVTFLKRLADAVNHEHWGVDRGADSIFAGFCAKYEVDVGESLLETIHSVELSNSLGIVRKQNPRLNRLGRRVVAGSDAVVDPQALQLTSLAPVRSDESANEWSIRPLPPEEELPLLLGDVANREDQLREQADRLRIIGRSLRRAQQQAAKTRRMLDDRERDIGQREDEIQRLTHSIASHERAAGRRDKVLAELQAEAQRLAKVTAGREVENERLRAQLEAIQNSWMWRISSPLRTFHRVVRAPRRSATIVSALGSALRTGGAKKALRLLRDWRVLSSSGLFDAGYYAQRNPDVLKAGMDLALHYLLYGAAEGRDPGPMFDTTWYLRQNPDVQDADVNPLVHYVRFGIGEGRSAMPTVGDRQRAPSSAPAATSTSTDAPLGSRLGASVARRLRNPERYIASIAEYRASRLARRARNVSSPRIAVYTAITGGYDSIKLPEHLDARFDYILFTDRPAAETAVWQVRPIAFFDNDPTRVSRYVKTHPQRLLNDYDIAVWIDSNVMILGDIYPMIEGLMESGSAIGVVPHPLRASIEQELKACIRQGKDDPELMRAQVEGYLAEGFKGEDLIESNFMIFDLRAEQLSSFLQTWWAELERHSKRDQLSLNYALWRSGTTWHPLMEQPTSIRNHPDFAFSLHDRGTGPAGDLVEALGCPTVDPYIGTPYAAVKHERLATRASRRVDVVVCVHNALLDVRACLESIAETRRSTHERLIIVDDGSESPTADYLRSFVEAHDWARLLRNSDALGYTKAANRGLRASDAEFVVLLNSDTVVTDGWAAKLADAVFSTPGAGIIGPLSNAASFQSIPEHRGSAEQTAINELPAGVSAGDMNFFCEQWTPSHFLPLVPLVHGFCFGITRAVLDSIGYLDDVNFPRGYGEENDYSFRARDAGYDLVVATHTYIFHSKSRSYGGKQRALLAQAGASALKEMYGGSRVARAVQTMDRHPLLVALRSRAAEVKGPPRRRASKVKHVGSMVPMRDNNEPEGSGYIRVIQPLRHPSLAGALSLSVLSPQLPSLDRSMDALVVQRDAIESPEDARTVAKRCRQLGLQLIYELDDDLFNLPAGHPAALRFSHRVKEAMRIVASEADAVTVSTAALQTTMAAYNDRIYLIPNALDETMWRSSDYRRSSKDDVVRIVYMGTRTHDQDLALLDVAIERTLREYSGRATFTCFGGFAKRRPATGFVVRDVPPWAQTYPQFVRWMVDMWDYDIAVAPLVDNTFNRHKSHIKYLDYGLCGLAQVLSNVPAYNGVVRDGTTGLLVENSDDSWSEALGMLIESDARRDQLGSSAYKDVCSRHTLAAQADARLRIWTEILS